MAEYTLTNSAAVVDASIQKVANATTTPSSGSPLMVTSGGVKAYVDTQDNALEAQILAIESRLETKSTGVSFERVAEFSTSSESYQTVPLSVKGQPDYFTNNGNNTFTILEGNYLMWFSFNWKTQLDNYPSANQLHLQLTTLSGMANFAGIGVFEDNRSEYSATIKTTLLDANFNNINQTTTFALQIKDDADGGNWSVYVKDVTLTILKV